MRMVTLFYHFILLFMKRVCETISALFHDAFSMLHNMSTVQNVWNDQ
jgi:hypothetical protein